ncbi:MFS transporter [Burkholderia sp. DN3021]|uniref:MFS transporter n=1 Tax=Burkholderia TaxID=32008 RepID=UPI00158E868E|nr:MULTISPECIES: MFS transporter [Burkholderia cepacia complex]MDR6498553.1 DHA2 family multidrug resistance protein [Burkholderia ambifaria]
MNTTFAPGGATPGPAAAPASDIPTFRSIAAIAAVLLGAIIATLTSRITSLGLADIRGALGVGFDEGAWINTAFIASQMFVGPLAIAAAFVFGTRRVLLAGAAVFLVVESVLPLCTNFGAFIVFQSLAGFASGVFVPLTVGFVVRTLPPRLIPFGIAAYAMNLEMSLNLSATLEGWYSEHLSWRWLFWQNALLTVPFIVCLMLSLSTEPIKRIASGIDTRGMLLGAGGFACLCIALDQGERLFWFQSPLIVALLCIGIVMVAAFLIHELTSRRAGLDLGYLALPNVALLILLVGLVRFTVLNTSFIPSAFLASTYGLRPLQIGDTLRWIAMPQLLFAPCVAWLLQRVDPRRLIVAGFAMVAVAFALGARLTPVWAEPDFIPSQLLQALGQTMALTSVVFFFGKHATAEHVLTFGAVVQTTRLLSGQLGTTSIAVVQRIMEATHSNLVGLHVTLSDPQTLERLRAGAALLVSHGATFATGDQAAYALLDRAVRIQATTLALADNFRVATAFAVAGVLIGLLLRPARAP